MERWIEFTAEFYDYYNRKNDNFSSTDLNDLYRKITPVIEQQRVGRLE